MPLQSLPQARAAFEIHNSPLTENALVGFEYGYNIQEPVAPGDLGSAIRRLHQRRADDDRRVHRRRRAASGDCGLRWCCCCRTRHEGQGPDHASARPERFLQLAADINMRIANCTTAAQYFHLLRRQAALLQVDPLPLVVLTPKSLLRHRAVASTPRELAEGRFRMVLPDEDAAARASDIRRVLVCSGKIYVDLIASEHRAARPDIAICRVEQLYPVPMRDLRALFDTLSQRERDRVGPGGAGEHGRVGFHPAASPGSVERTDSSASGAAAKRQPGGRIGGPSRAQSAGARGPGVRRSTARAPTAIVPESAVDDRSRLRA